MENPYYFNVKKNSKNPELYEIPLMPIISRPHVTSKRIEIMNNKNFATYQLSREHNAGKIIYNKNSRGYPQILPLTNKQIKKIEKAIKKYEAKEKNTLSQELDNSDYDER